MPTKHHEHVRPPFKEYLKGVPGLVGIRLDEEPQYHVRDTIDGFELRDYPKMTAATFRFMGIYEDFRKVAFPHLADYIFSNGIDMTIPVILENSGNLWKMSFLLPAKIKMRNAPEPAEKSVILETVPARHVLVGSFTGDHDLEKMREVADVIETKFARSSKFLNGGRAFWALYDAPTTLSFMKRNEVWLPVNVQGA